MVMSHVICKSKVLAKDLILKANFLYIQTDHSMDWGWEMPLIQPGVHHSNQRKMLRRAIGPQRVARHYTRIESEVSKLITVLNTFQGAPISVIQEYVNHNILDPIKD
jgi:hypothetical protein